LCDPINYHGNITATTEITCYMFLQASCYPKLSYCESINLSINPDSVATILIACIICEQHASNNTDTGDIWVSETLFTQALLLKTEDKREIIFFFIKVSQITFIEIRLYDISSINSSFYIFYLHTCKKINQDKEFNKHNNI